MKFVIILALAFILLVPSMLFTNASVVDFESYLDDIKKRYGILEESIDYEYQNLRNGVISPNEYISVAEVTSSQITSQISEFVTSKPTEEWQSSYVNYMDGLKKFNLYIGETKVLANLIENDGTQKQIDDTIQRIELLKSEYQKYLKISDESRPLNYVPPKILPFEELSIDEQSKIIKDSSFYKFEHELMRLIQLTLSSSEIEVWEFVGEEKRQRYEQTLAEIESRGISFNSINGIQMSRLSDYEQAVVKDAMIQSVEFLKYKSAELLYKMDELRDEIKDYIQKSSLPQNEKDSIIDDFDFYTDSKRTESIDTLGTEIMTMQSSLSIQESPQKIGSDINSYYDDMSRGGLFSFESTIDSEPTSNGGGCLIATATYGSELAPQVQQLRELRDNQLLATQSGTNFMNTFNDVYYSFSPIIADYERENPIFKEMVKVAITPMITSLSLMEYAESESEVLGIGISLIILNVMMYVGIPVIAVMRFRR